MSDKTVTIDPFERIVRAIVEGQIRGFLKEHPQIVDAVDWYKPRQDKATTFTNSLAKRIVRDLVCGTTTARLRAALLASSTDAPPTLDCGRSTAASAPDLALRTGSGDAAAQMPLWYPLETLVLDGRQVWYKAPYGEFRGPALAMHESTAEEKARMYARDGSWPNVLFTVVAWREIVELGN